MIDLMFLTKLPKEYLTEDKKIVKFLEKEGTEQLPKNCRIYFSYRQYDWRGDPVKTALNLLFRENDNCQGICTAIRSMRKDEKAWFKIPESYLGQREGSKLATEFTKQGSYFCITIDDSKLKVDQTSGIQERLDYFSQNKALADAAYAKGSYIEAAKLYNTNFNIFNSLPKKLERTEATEHLIKKGLVTCKRNYVLSVVKGELKEEQQGARKIITALAAEDPSAKTLYIYGKLLLQMKYISDARKVLQQSLKIEQNPETLKLLEQIKDSSDKQKIVCKHIIENLEKERIQESKKKKRQAKDQWFLKADKEEEKKLVIQKAIEENELDPQRLGMLDDDWN